MTISDISNLLIGSSIEQTIVNIVAFLSVLQFIGLLFIFLANLTRR